MNKYKTLNAMGIQNPQQIRRHEVYMYDNTDILRVVYTREPGSILPVTRQYKFPRIKKPTLVDSGSRQTTVLYESSSEFRNALDELEQLMDQKTSPSSNAMILEELGALEAEMRARIHHIKSMVENRH